MRESINLHWQLLVPPSESFLILRGKLTQYIKSSHLILIVNVAENSPHRKCFWVEVLGFSSNRTSTDLPSYPKWTLGNTYLLLLLNKVTCLVRVFPSCLTFMSAGLIWQLLLNWLKLNMPGIRAMAAHKLHAFPPQRPIFCCTKESS